MWKWVDELDEGPADDRGMSRDFCYAWTNKRGRCGRSGVGWPVPGFSRVHLCHQHREEMDDLVRMVIERGDLVLTEVQARKIDPQDAAPHFVYRYYDADDKPLYIGMTRRPSERERSHAEKGWFARVCRKEITEYPTKYAAVLAERKAIGDENPEFNKVHRTAFPELAAATP